jgi:NADPH2 dehydrogenase
MALYKAIGSIKTVSQLRACLAELNLDLPVADNLLSAEQGSALGRAMLIGKHCIGNRWCINPMEGWDANTDGSPTEKVVGRWRKFGISGAKFVWGGEAAAVLPNGRANPNQTMAVDSNFQGLTDLREALFRAHQQEFETTNDMFVSLQLTHSGRWCKPADHKKFSPTIAYRHPWIEKRYHFIPWSDDMIITDDWIEHTLIPAYVNAAKLAAKAGYGGVDIKACHGYLGHEFLSARRRPGKFGGDLQGRSRFLIEIINRVREACPELVIGVRLSFFDMVPFTIGENQLGVPVVVDGQGQYDCGFGVNPNNPTEIDLTEPLELVGLLIQNGVQVLNISGGSPYYNNHIQRPTLFPPSDGYHPPEDPLIGVYRLLNAARVCKTKFPDLPIVATGLTYCQEFLPHVAQACVEQGWFDFAGIGRMVLSHPTLPALALRGENPERKKICRTFSACTTAPRNGIISGCYPLDPDYKDTPEHQRLKQVTKQS